MDSPIQATTLLRHRMMEDMRMRKLNPHTQDGYIRAVRKFTKYLGRSPDTATVKDLRNFQLHLVDHGISPVTLNATITGLKFFFDITLNRAELMARMQPVHVPRTLSVILSREEAGRLIAAARNLKHQTILSVAYGTGLRASEVVALKVVDIDSERMTFFAQIARLLSQLLLLCHPKERDNNAIMTRLHNATIGAIVTSHTESQRFRTRRFRASSAA